MAAIKKVKKAQPGIMQAQAPIRKGASRPPTSGLRKAVVNEAFKNADVMDPKFDPMKMQKLRADATKKSYYKKGGKVTRAQTGKTVKQSNADMMKAIEAREKRIAARDSANQRKSYTNERANKVIGKNKTGGKTSKTMMSGGKMSKATHGTKISKSTKKK
jgi:hypothetical protein